MARTKKSESAVPAEEQDTTLPQTAPELAGEPENISQTDMEPAADGTPEPEAPQTDPEPKQYPEPGDSPPPEIAQIDWGAPAEGEIAGYPADDDPFGSQTDWEMPAEGEPAESECPACPQTDLENGAEGPGTESSGEDTDGAPQTDWEMPEGLVDPEEHPADTSQASAQPERLRLPRRRGPRVVTIDSTRSVETEDDRIRSDFLDLVESMKSKHILTGTVQSVGRERGDPDNPFFVTYHGDFEVRIPVMEAILEPEDYRGQPKGDVLHYMLSKRMGAEIDYIVTNFDSVRDERVTGSRLQAMAIKRRDYFFRTDREGNYQIYSDVCAEARVVSVIRSGIFVDLFGAECFIPLSELSYQRWADATSHYQPGQRVLVKVLEVDRSDRNDLRVELSVKQAGANPYEKAFKRYAVGNRYVGTVSMVDATGVFVSLDGGIDCLCTYPPRGRPPRGCRVTVRILGVNEESNRIWGVITHMSSVR